MREISIFLRKSRELYKYAKYLKEQGIWVKKKKVVSPFHAFFFAIETIHKFFSIFYRCPYFDVKKSEHSPTFLKKVELGANRYRMNTT